MKITFPKNGPYTVYCYQCKHYLFEAQIGAAILGKCTHPYLEEKSLSRDAYTCPCPLFDKRTEGMRGGTYTAEGSREREWN